MQATVGSWQDGSGSLVLDDGRVLRYAADALADSGLRLLRRGQRVGVEVDGDRVRRIWIHGVGPARTPG